MNHWQVEDALDDMRDYYTSYRYERCLTLARQTKAAMLEHPKADPHLLGWVRFYEYKALYRLERYQDAYDLINMPEPQPYMMDAKNSSWMFSVASELAAHLNRPHEIVEWGSKCLDTRLRVGNVVEALQCCQTVCVLLSMVGRNDLNRNFAEELIAQGMAVQAERPIILGYGFLAANAEASHDPELIERLLDGKDDMESFGPPFRHEAEPVLEMIASLL